MANKKAAPKARKISKWTNSKPSGKLKSPIGPPPPLPVIQWRYARGSHGAPADRGPRICEMLDNMQQTINDANAPSKSLAAAAGVWLGYPLILEMIGHDWRSDGALTNAYDHLNRVHLSAIKLLMKRAEQLDIDSSPIWTAAQICQSLFRSEPWNYYVGPFDTWPECLGAKLRTLPESEQTAIRDGHAAVVRLSVKNEIECELAELLQAKGNDKKSVGHGGKPGSEWPPDESWHFENTCVWFRRTQYSIDAYPLALLKLFVNSPHTDFSVGQLHDEVWGDKAVENNAVEKQVSELRKLLRRIAKEKVIPIAKDNPLPGKNGAWQFVMPRS